MDFQIPDPLKAEHEELHAELMAAIGSGGAVGHAAKAVAELLHSPFVKEEAYALPPPGSSGKALLKCSSTTARRHVA